VQEKTQEVENYDSFVDMEKKANLTQMIIEKAHQIEENMKMDS
jgi:hexokinase